jgi:HAD superfamily hydrolase (TIGR01509 family)
MTLIIFDCDGTLVDSELLHAQVEVDLIREKFGIVSDVAEYNRRFCGAGLPEVYVWLEKEIGYSLPDDFANEISDRKNEAFSKKLKAVPNVGKILNGMTSIPKCVASNTPLVTVKLSLQTTGLAKFFEPHIYSAQMVARGKPAPDLFLFAAKQMNVLPQDCIVIEDSPHGVKAALAAGIRVFGFVGGGHCYPDYQEKLKDAELIFNDMRELPDLIKQGGL